MKSMTLKEARLMRGWTQEELEARSGVTQQHISRLESDLGANPTKRTIDKLAAALRIQGHQLIFLSTPENEPVRS